MPNVDVNSKAPLGEVDVYVVRNCNKMQSETADFAPGAATWRTRRNIRFASSLIILPIALLYYVPNLECMLNCRQMRPRVTCTENLVKFGLLLRYENGQTNRQTHRHTDMTTIGDEVKMHIQVLTKHKAIF